VRLVVEAQLDPGLSKRERVRRLTRLVYQIEYWQRKAEKAARAHAKEGRRRLRKLGIRLSKIQKCFSSF
jgi:hypothetical protein